MRSQLQIIPHIQFNSIKITFISCVVTGLYKTNNKIEHTNVQCNRLGAIYAITGYIYTYSTSERFGHLLIQEFIYY